MAFKIGGWLGGAWERNRDAAGKTLKALAPLASLIPLVGPLGAAGWGALAGSLGTAAQRGTNIGDILASGAASGASAAAGNKFMGGKASTTVGEKLKAAGSNLKAAPGQLKSFLTGGGAASPVPSAPGVAPQAVPWFRNPAVISTALETAGGLPKTFAEAEQAKATAERTRGATALDAYDLQQKRLSDAALNEMLKRIRSGGM